MLGQGWDHNDIRGARVGTVAPATATALWHLLWCDRQLSSSSTHKDEELNVSQLHDIGG
jgi:hypothetical protein